MESNFTTPAPEWPSPAPASLLFALGVLGNVLALTILCCSAKTHKWRPFYRFVCGLAITDGGGISLSYPLIMIRYASYFQYDYPKAMCDYMAFILMFTILASASIVCAMSLDRFLAILYPHVYNTPTKNRRAVVMILGIWSFSAFVASLHLMAGRKSLPFFPGSWCFLDFVYGSDVDRILALVYSLIGISILTTTAVLNTTVIISVCRNIRHKKKATKKKDVYIIGFLMLIVILFSTCITPLLINVFGHAVGTITGNGQFELFALRISVTNSIIDPWIYIVFRKSTVEFFQRKALQCGIIPRSLSSDDAPPPREETSGTQESSHDTSAI